VIEFEFGAASENQQRGDRDVDGRPGNGDEKFLARLFRNALEPRHAADRQQDHVGRRDAEGARSKDVPELVQHHAKKQQQQEFKSVPGLLRASRNVADAENPGEKQQECHMDADRRAGDGPDVQRPAHDGLLGTAFGNLAELCLLAMVCAALLREWQRPHRGLTERHIKLAEAMDKLAG
jgi:hypothetical protein